MPQSFTPVQSSPGPLGYTSAPSSGTTTPEEPAIAAADTLCELSLRPMADATPATTSAALTRPRSSTPPSRSVTPRPRSLTPRPAPSRAEDVRYAGDTYNGVRHGLGTCWYPNGTVYNGLWHNGLPQGLGSLCGVDGLVIYTGDWHAGLFHGFGTFYFPTGTWIGHAECGTAHGPGFFTSHNGITSPLEFERGKILRASPAPAPAA